MSGVCVSEWLFECTVQKLVLVITSLETNDVLERWQFDIECDKSAKESRSVTDLAGFLLTCPLHPPQPFISFSFYWTLAVFTLLVFHKKGLRWRC